MECLLLRRYVKVPNGVPVAKEVMGAKWSACC